MTSELFDVLVIRDRLSRSIDESASSFLSIIIQLMNLIFFLNYVFLFYIRLKLSNVRGYVLFVFINSEICSEILPRFFARQFAVLNEFAR